MILVYVLCVCVIFFYVFWIMKNLPPDIILKLINDLITFIGLERSYDFLKSITDVYRRGFYVGSVSQDATSKSLDKTVSE